MVSEGARETSSGMELVPAGWPTGHLIASAQAASRKACMRPTACGRKPKRPRLEACWSTPLKSNSAFRTAAGLRTGAAVRETEGSPG
jgi:hypothetical protein